MFRLHLQRAYPVVTRVQLRCAISQFHHERRVELMAPPGCTRPGCTRLASPRASSAQSVTVTTATWRSIAWCCGIACVEHLGGSDRDLKLPLIHWQLPVYLPVALDMQGVRCLRVRSGFVALAMRLVPGLPSAGVAAHQLLCWRLSATPTVPLAAWVERASPASLRVLHAAWPLRRDRPMELRKDRLPGVHVARTDGGVDEGSFDWPHARGRLFGVLVWAGAGFAGISALSLVLFELLRGRSPRYRIWRIGRCLGLRGDWFRWLLRRACRRFLPRRKPLRRGRRAGGDAACGTCARPLASFSP